MPEKTYEEASRSGWIPHDGVYRTEQLVLGSLQRIASATEIMAKNHQQLLDDAERWKRWYQEKSEELVREQRRNAALRGRITKLKKQQALTC